MTDEERSKIMDNLIAQDADLIDVDGRIAELEREKAVVSDLLEQQKELALEYLFDCNRAAKRIAELEIEAQAQYDRGYYDGHVAALGETK